MATSGNALFDRRCKLTISNPVDTPGDFKNTTTTNVIEINGGTTGNTDVPGMRIQFKVHKTLKKEPNTSEITVSNLSDDTRSKLQKKGVRVTLEAGYKEIGVFRIFSGDVRTVDHVRNGADWETVFRLGDGERAWQFALVSVSFSPGTKVSDAIRTIARSMGLGMGNVDNQLSNITTLFDQGYAAHGNASRALDQVMKSIRMPWSVQDGELQFLPEDKSLELNVPDITPDSGLIGSPQMGSPPHRTKPQLVKFKSLLVSTKPGANVFLTSKRYPKSKILVHACRFIGDTHGGEWETEIDGTISQ